jgi:hypothetical protein
VEARFGALTLQESFTLLEAQALNINFVFNAGALRVLPRLKGMAPPDITTKTRIFALTGKSKGNLVRETSEPGEVINLVAGNYRIESKLVMGNTVAVADVRVVPGLMSAIEIDHRVGLARLAYVGAPDARVEWEIKRGPITEISHFLGLNASLALLPGTYTAVARVGGESLSATFEIEEGKTRDIMLGN